jgi:hypothetical protein
MNGASGKVGDLVFRQFQGKTIVQAYSEPKAKRTELQKLFNHKMREAATHARAALRNPAIKAHYEKKKMRLNVTSAYTAACTDFLRHGRIDKVDTSKYDKGLITVKAFKADLGFEEVVVKILKKDGKLVSATKGIPKEQGNWLFKINQPLPPLGNVIISVEARDKTGNVTRLVQEAGKKDLEYHDWKGSPHLGASPKEITSIHRD